ncbi:polyamine transporter 1 [Histoplasma ohiense]|nr:polyamine transporter 1 [Histoplasma ohiense (nom. inval.)]
MPTNGELYSRPLSDGAVNTDNLGNTCYAKRNSTHAIVQPQQDGGVQAFGEGGGAWEVVLLPIATNPIDKDDEDLEVHWDCPDDPANPRNFPLILRWSMVIIISLCSLCTICTSALYTMTYEQITVEFNCSRLIATLGLSLFILGLGVGPLFLAPLSEFYGRRPLYLVAMALFVLWLIPCATAQNIQTMLIARFFGGFSSSAFMTVAGGSMSDLFSHDELQRPMMVYTATPFLGPIIGPVVGAFINQYTSWRWSFYFAIIWSSVLLIFMVLFMSETYHPVLLRHKAQRLRKETGRPYYAWIEKTDKSIATEVMWSFSRPLQLLLLEPMVTCLCVYTSIALGILYLFLDAFYTIFTNNYGFELYQVGLSFLGLLFGTVTSAATHPFWNWNYRRLVRKREAGGGEPGASEPEYRLPPAIASSILLPLGMFWFGWTTHGSIHWIVPIIGSGFFSAGVVLAFNGVLTFLVHAYPVYSASAMGANLILRSIFAAAFPIFGIQLYEKLGDQWATSLLGFVTVAMMPFPYLFYRYGARLRAKSRWTARDHFKR